MKTYIKTISYLCSFIFLLTACTSDPDPDEKGDDPAIIDHDIAKELNYQWLKRQGELVYRGYATGDKPISCLTADGGLIGVVATHTGSWLYRLDNEGNILWNKQLGELYKDVFYDIKETTDGGIILAGTSYEIVQGSNKTVDNYLLLKLDAQGNRQWVRTYEGRMLTAIYSVDLVNDGGYILAGYSNNVPSSGSTLDKQFWIAKVSSTGLMEWQRSYGGSKEDIAYSVATATDGSYIMAGISKSWDGHITRDLGGSGAYWVVKVDANANLIWQKLYGTAGTMQSPETVKATPDGGCVVVGVTHGGGYTGADVSEYFSGTDGWIIKLDANGVMEWEKSVGDHSSEHLMDVLITEDGGYLTVGVRRDSRNANEQRIMLTKLNRTGKIEWNKHYDIDNQSLHAHNIHGISSTGYFVTGYSYQIGVSDAGQTTFFVSKFK